jgi:hypothetical protein
MRMPDRREILESLASLPFLRATTVGGRQVSKSPWIDRVVMWRRILDDKSFELATLTRVRDSYLIRGTALIAEAEVPCRVDYVIECDGDWRTRKSSIQQVLAGETTELHLAVRDGKWRRNGLPAPDLEGCIDIDLGISPSTNALPINRLRIPIGGEAKIRAAWVQFPQCTIEAAQQSYERLSLTRYRYRSMTSGFTAAIEVDDAGLPSEYSGIWRRVAATRGAVAARALGEGGLSQNEFTSALVSPGPSAELGSAADAFAWLIGGWRAQVRDFGDDGSVGTGTGEWWFSWVLEGRAIQDVWIVPARADRGGHQTADNRYGSTLRYFDRAADLWRIVWVNPVSGALNILQGRPDGSRFTLEGTKDGAPIRWTFEDIRPDSFVWRGERKTNEESWKTSAEFRLWRIA